MARKSSWMAAIPSDKCRRDVPASTRRWQVFFCLTLPARRSPAESGNLVMAEERIDRLGERAARVRSPGFFGMTEHAIFLSPV